MDTSSESKRFRDESGSSSSSSSDISDKDHPVLQKIRNEFLISKDKMKEISESMLKEMEKGLGGEASTLKMIPSFVSHMPDGSEKGTFYSLDLGGTNFRVSSFKLEEGKPQKLSESSHVIPKSAMESDTSDELFDFIAKHIVSNSNDKSDKKLGFTFSFPIEQKSINSGTLIEWTKGFKTGGVKGKDVVELLHAALKKQNLENVEIVALCNDTVGTLAARSFIDQSCRIGMIIGTGTNAAYVEKMSNIKKLSQEKSISAAKSLKGKEDEEMIVNMEWGAFGNGSETVLPRTDVDREVDKESLNVGMQYFEKMISGYYLGEITRRNLVRLIEGKELWTEAKYSKKIFTPYSLDAKDISEIESDKSDDLHLVKKVEAALEIEGSTLNDRKVFKEVCGLVAERAARLTASALKAVLTKIGEKGDGCDIGVDGSVFEKHSTFHGRLKKSLDDMSCNCKLSLSKDGSGLGAALIAAAKVRHSA